MQKLYTERPSLLESMRLKLRMARGGELRPQGRCVGLET